MTDKLLNENEFSLLRLVPDVLRARDFRLYTNGGRLIDLWLNGGAAILGHTPPSLLREIKNTASRGLYAPFPHFLEGRFKKALSGILPGRNFIIYCAPPQELQTLLAEGKAALWRPFANHTAPLSVSEGAPPVLIPVVPGIQGWSGGLPYGLCVLAINPTDAPPLPAGNFLPPVLLAAAVRGIYDLTAAAPQRAKIQYKLIYQALKNSQWKQQGIYLIHKRRQSPDEWEPLFRRFLEAGFLIPPVPTQPVILPGILSPGEEAKLAGVLAGEP